MIIHKLFPVFNWNLSLQVFNDTVSLLECLENFLICNCTFNIAKSLLEHHLGTVRLFNFFRLKLLLFEENHCALLLTIFDQLLYFISSFFLLQLKLLCICPDLAHAGLNIKDCLILLSDSILIFSCLDLLSLLRFVCWFILCLRIFFLSNSATHFNLITILKFKTL